MNRYLYIYTYVYDIFIYSYVYGVSGGLETRAYGVGCVDIVALGWGTKAFTLEPKESIDIRGKSSSPKWQANILSSSP